MITKCASSVTRIVITSALICTVAVSGCDSKDKKLSSLTKSSEQLTHEPLLDKLPASTAAFTVMDFSGEGYRQFSRSPYGSTQNAKKSIDAMVEKIRNADAGETLALVMQRVLESGVKLGIVSEDGTYTVEKVISRSIVFGGPASGAPLPFQGGIFLKAASGVSMAEKLEVLKSSLTGASLTIVDQSIDGASKSFSVDLPNVPTKIHFSANSELLGIALDKAAVEGLFSGKITGTIDAIRSSAEYKQASSPIEVPEKPLAFTYVSLLRLRPLLEAAAAADTSGELKAEEIPFDAFAVQSSFPKEYVHSIGLAVTPKTEMQTKVFSALQGGALSPATTKIPTDAAFAISLDTHFLGKLEPMIKSIEEGAPIGLSEHTKQLESVTVGLRNNQAGSPLPDIFLVLESAAREQLAGFLESALGLAMSLTGQNATWQTKDFDGTPTKFFTTLIGAGVYLSSPGSSRSLLIGSSDTVLKDLIGTQSGKTASLSASMPERMKRVVESANVASFYCNFQKVADVLDSAKNTLAMFTGGNSELNDLLESANLRSWGLSAGSISYTPGVVAINSTLAAAPQ